MGLCPAPFFSITKIMASGRVGGTRSKISGQVGNVIYQVVKNDNGTYTQISYGKPEDVTATITPRLQAQRMCTCMVEALMRDLKEVGRISMQSAPNKSKSLNAFSSFNIQLVARDCKQHWYGGNKFYYPYTNNIGTPSEQLGGEFLLSSGSWQFNGFDEVVHVIDPENIWPNVFYVGKRFAGIRFSISNQPETVAGFLQRHYLSLLDRMVFACFHDWWESVEGQEERVYHTKHSYIFVDINTGIGQGSVISESVLKDLFVTSSDIEVFSKISDDGRSYYIGFLIDNRNDDAYFYTEGAFTISKLEGKPKISSSTLNQVPEDEGQYFLNQAPADVFGSWMGEPSRKPYPSPF